MTQRLVYVVLCHHSAASVVDLFRCIWRPQHHYILHADAKSAASLRETVARLAAAFPNVHALAGAPCSWGGWSLVRTTLRAIDHAITLPTGWSHVVLLSESHVPLVAPEAAAAMLAPGVSYLDAEPVSDYGPPGRSDVMHRFAARYEELPGVGMFAAAPRAQSAKFTDMLNHGSQWMVLARTACERLHARQDDAALWEPFRSSLLADETAFQTLLLGGALGPGLTTRRRPTTFVSWPHLSGNADTTFTEQNFQDARAQGFLFIRKRPATLPEGVARALAPMHMTEALPQLPEPDETFTGGAPVAALAAALHQALAARFPGLAIDTLSPLRAGGSPTCYLQFRCPGLPQALCPALLSEDMVRFKVLLGWLRNAFDDFGPATLGGYPTSLLKARVWTLFLQREVLLPDLPGGGFVTMAEGVRADGAGLDRLAGPIAGVLEAGVRLAPALAAG